MDKKKEFNASNFMPEDLLEIICILERGEKLHLYKIMRKRNDFFSHHQISGLEWRIDAIEEQLLIRMRKKFLLTTSAAV